ncbi:MAG: hypothetical protein ACLGG7_13080 [Bacteriovoracia bacterium]
MKPVTLILLLSVLAACSNGGTTTGNPVRVQLRLVDQQPFAWWRPVKNHILVPDARAAVTNAVFCFKRLRFKALATDESTTSGNVDVELGRVAIDPAGTALQTVSVPAGRYERIEFDLEKDCDGVGGTPSVAFSNDLAPFSHSTQDGITIKFEGVFVAEQDAVVDLNVDVFFDVMDTISDGANIKPSFELLSGDF